MSASSTVTDVSDFGIESSIPIQSTTASQVRTNRHRTDSLHVLHIVNGEHFAGAERVQSHLGRCLPDLGVRADFVCVKPGRFADMLDQRDGTQEHWGHCHRIPMRRRWDRSCVNKLIDIVEKERVHLLHAHTPRTAMISSATSDITGIPWIYHLHSPASRDGSQWIRNRINAWVEQRSLRNVLHQIAVSSSLKSDITAACVDPDSVTVVFNGVPAIRPPRESRPIVGGPWTLGMIALMRPRKGLEIAIDAIADLESRGVDVNLRCIGPFETDAYRRQIDARIRDRQIGHRIEWLGFTNDVPSELSRLDAMVLPSLYGEGLPMVVLESMAAGTPVIATRVEGTPEAVQHGVEGLLAEPNDAGSLAEQIECLVTGQVDWTRMSEAAVKRHSASFSDRTMATQTAEVYRRVLQS